MSRSKQVARLADPDFWSVFRDLPEPYMLFRANDPEFTIIEVNKARVELMGIPRESCVGKPLFSVFPDLSDTYKKTGVNRLQEYLRRLVSDGTAEPLDILRYDLVRPDGVKVVRYWRPSYTLIRDRDGRVEYVLAASHDITEETLAEREMANMEDRLAAALAIGKVGSWVWDVSADIVIGDRNLAKLFGLDKEQVIGGLPLESFMRAIHPDDLPRVRRAIQNTVRQHVQFDEEYRTLAAGGEIRWVLARGKIELQGKKMLFPGVIVDVTERRDLQAQIELARRQDQLNRRESKILQKRNEELETISRTKDEFVALASHQLRTPATAVKQYLGMVLQGYVGEISDIQTEMLQKAFESNERQIQIINQILNAARVDTGRLAMTIMPIDLKALVRGVADDMRSSLEQRRHVFRVRLPRAQLTVSADLGYLRMAIENVLHNAGVYTPEGGHITLHLKRAGREAMISVTDTGVGIKKADLGKLFTKFSRIHNPLSVQAGGSGIGLYLAAEIIRLHSGEVTVESKIGHGTTFAIFLPLSENTSKAERSKISAAR
ncbi:MAG TPA: ATP-binding protein [Candidatus Saccharimonadales bacterium]|nr:ATP-binding protein [Candidatus Saccharimonadales bacterium]